MTFCKIGRLDLVKFEIVTMLRSALAFHIWSQDAEFLACVGVLLTYKRIILHTITGLLNSVNFCVGSMVCLDDYHIPLFLILAIYNLFVRMF
jgi:hypothetical protein